MGKSRPRRFGNMRPNPTGIISEREISIDIDAEQMNGLQQNSATSSSVVPSTISNILEKLQGISAEEKICGCQLMASIVSQPKAIGCLLQANVTKIVAPLFLDPCSEVRHSSLGAVRNMTVYGRADVCEVLIANDILTPLTAVIKQVGHDWVPEGESAKSETSAGILIEGIELLTNLCESSETAIRWFNKEDLLKVLLPLVNQGSNGSGLSITIARCLHVVSENNPSVSTVCQQPDVLTGLLSVMSSTSSSPDELLLKTLVTGIVLNLNEVDLNMYYKGIVGTIADVLDIDVLVVVTAALNKHQEAAKGTDCERDVSWPEVDTLLTTQGISLELLANLCCSDDDWEDVDGQRSSESSDEQSMGACVQTADMMEDNTSSLCLSNEITSLFLERDLLAKVLKKVSSYDAALVAKLESIECGRTTLEKLRDLQSRALLCLSNMIGAIDGSYFTQFTPLNVVWLELYKLATISQGVQNEDFMWAVTSAMRAVVHRLAELQSATVCEVSSSDLEFLLNLGKVIKNRETQINVIRILSTIGCVLSAQLPLHSLLKTVGLILTDVACNSDDLVVASEALDSLFDVFKEDHTDPVVQEINLMSRLVSLLPSFKSKVSNQRKRLGENYSVVMMAKSNLVAFIKYKQNQYHG